MVILEETKMVNGPVHYLL